MPKNFQDYLGNKVTFLKWEDNGLLLAKFIEFFCRVLTRHYYNKFRKLITKYSNDSKDHKGHKPKRILPFASVMLSSPKYYLQWWLPLLPQLPNCLSLLDIELMKLEWIVHPFGIWYRSSTELCSPCFLPARFTHLCASLRNQNKCKPSIYTE